MCENFHLYPNRITSHRVMSLFILGECYKHTMCTSAFSLGYYTHTIFFPFCLQFQFEFDVYPTVVGKTTTLISVHDFSQNLHHIIVVCRKITNCSADKRENGIYGKSKDERKTNV